jgi:Na+/H+ antiporter NhaD/arsenite permease-like protein
MESGAWINYLMIFFFVVGYFLIAIEHYTKINKATVALLMAVGCWALQFASVDPNHTHMGSLEHELSSISQTVFFLLGALTVVEVINQHKGFNAISKLINFRSKKTMLWVVSIITFILSGILDNLTTTVVMLSLLKKLVDEGEERLIIGGAIVIAANAGGAWTPIGDITTTMLWIGGKLSTLGVIKTLWLPSIVCTLVSCFFLSFFLKGDFEKREISSTEKDKEPFGNFILIMGILLLIFVPIFKVLTGLPPFMGMLLALGILWLITDIAHSQEDDRDHLRVPNIFAKIDFSGVFFFLGILLCVGALYSAGLLGELATWLHTTIGSLPVISLAIGFASAIIDSVPLVAATMGMYSLEQFPSDHTFWNMIAYCAGIGGSILIIGSAAGIAFMSLEKVDFLWYLRRISLPATFGYLAGFGVYLLLHH